MLRPYAELQEFLLQVSISEIEAFSFYYRQEQIVGLLLDYASQLNSMTLSFKKQAQLFWKREFLSTQYLKNALTRGSGLTFLKTL